MDALKQMLREDRQWRRADRIAHYRYQLARATDRYAQDFWMAALEANGA